VGGHPGREGEEAGVPVDDRADVDGDLRVGGQVLAELAHDRLRVQRRRGTRGALVPDAVPPPHGGLDLAAPPAARLALAQPGQQRAQGLARVADERDVDRVLRTDLAATDVDLHDLRLTGRRVVLGPRVAAADDQQGVAAAHQVARRGGAEVAHHPAVVRQPLVEHGLAQQRGGDAGTRPLRHRQHLFGRAVRTLADQQRDPLARVEQRGGRVQLGVGGEHPRPGEGCP
jgi:hypothetical protein